MKIFKALYERCIRLIVSACHQIPWVLAGVAIYFYAHATFPEKIKNAFGIVEAQRNLSQITESTVFMKNMISVSNPVASVNYLASLFNQTAAWSKLNFSQMLANVGTTFCLWLVDILLLIGGLYLIWCTYKTYRHKGHQKEEALLVTKELAPYFKELENQIQSLQNQILALKEKNGKSDFTDSLDTGD